MALTTAERTNIIKLVVGMFNAAPGATYLAELTVAFEANGRSLSNLAKDLALTPAYKAINPVFQTAAEFATSFLTPLGLQANTTAVDFVTAKFNAGVSKGQIAYEAIVALNASTAAEFADAKAIVTNKTTVAEYYSVTKNITQTNVATLQQVVSTVTKDAASVTTANTAIDGSGAANAGSTFTLTTGIDVLNGSTGNDTFIGSIAPATLSGADQINGGGGTDTLKVYGGTTLPALTGVEILYFNAPGADVNVSTLADVTTLQIDNDTTGYTHTISAAQNVGLTAVSGAATVLTTATDTSLDLTVNAFAAAAGAALALDIKGAALATLNIASQTAASNITLNNKSAATAFKTLNVSGDAGITIDAQTNALTGITTVDASKHTGTTAGVSYSASDAKVKFTGGTGGDTVTFVATKLTADDVVDGGAGTDTIKVNDVAFTAGTTDQVKGVNKSTNVETLAFGTAGVTVDKDVITATAITNFRADVGGGTYTFNNTLSANTIEIRAGAADTTIGANLFTIANKLGETTTNLKMTATSGGIADVAQLKLVGISTINIESAFAGTGSQATANSVVVTAQSDNTVFNVKGAQAINVTALAGATTTGSTLDATAATGKVGLTGTNKVDSIKGGAAADTLNGLQGADTLTGAAGADTFSFTSTAGANANGETFGTFDTITDFVAGTDKLQFAGVTDVVSGQQAGVQAAVTALAAGSSATAIATAMATANTTNLGVSFAVFEGNTYVLFETTGAGTGVIADDVFIKLTGVAALPTFATDVVA
ncbi:MAG: beta strand repeat-containing protein [Ramlibacter sp.]